MTVTLYPTHVKKNLHTSLTSESTPSSVEGSGKPLSSDRGVGGPRILCSIVNSFWLCFASSKAAVELLVVSREEKNGDSGVNCRSLVNCISKLKCVCMSNHCEQAILCDGAHNFLILFCAY